MFYWPFTSLVHFDHHNYFNPGYAYSSVPGASPAMSLTYAKTRLLVLESVVDSSPDFSLFLLDFDWNENLEL